MDDLQIIILCLCGIPLLLLLFVFGPPAIIVLPSFSHSMQRFASRHRRSALLYLVLLGFISFSWIHVSVARVGATTTRVWHNVVTRIVAGMEGFYPNAYDPIPDQLQQAVDMELWIRWILPFRDSTRCYTGNIQACVAMDEALTPHPEIGIILGTVSTIILIGFAKNRLKRAQDVD